MKTFLFNPYTGTPRHPLDIQSDPEGLLIHDSTEPLLAAQPTTPVPGGTVAQGEAALFGVQNVDTGVVLTIGYRDMEGAIRGAKARTSNYSVFRPVSLSIVPPGGAGGDVGATQDSLHSANADSGGVQGRSAELDSYRRMFTAACADLGAVNEALGLDPNDGGAEPILDAIKELQANPWKEAMLDGLAGACIDAPQDEDPSSILKRIIEVNILIATQGRPTANGTFACSICGQDTPHHHTAEDVALTNMFRMKDAEVDAELRAAGIEPEDAAKRGRQAIQDAIRLAAEQVEANPGSSHLGSGASGGVQKDAPPILNRDGWVFHSADFSLGDRSRDGAVTLKRDKAGTDWWFSLDEDARKNVCLYVTGYGTTFYGALKDAYGDVANHPVAGSSTVGRGE